LSAERDRTVGVVGLGNMGLPMARTLAEKGWAVLGCDLAPERRAAAAAAGIEAGENVAETVRRARFLVLSLPKAEHVAGVVEAAGLLAPGLSRTLVIDTSTSEPEVSRRLAAALAGAGHGFLDAPVSGGPAGAAAGTLAVMVGGGEADLAEAQPVLEALAAKVVHVGASGAGNVAKLVNNLLVAAHMLTTREALRLAAAAGVEPEAALKVVNAATGRSAISEVHVPTWVLSGRFDSGFSAGLMRKDVMLARALAARAGLDLPLADLVAALWSEAESGVSDADDFTRLGDPAAPRPTREVA
jgi:3-hydroxyisobutyrate dehydrogenase